MSGTQRWRARLNPISSPSFREANRGLRKRGGRETMGTVGERKNCRRNRVCPQPEGSRQQLRAARYGIIREGWETFQMRLIRGEVGKNRCVWFGLFSQIQRHVRKKQLKDSGRRGSNFGSWERREGIKKRQQLNRDDGGCREFT